MGILGTDLFGTSGVLITILGSIPRLVLGPIGRTFVGLGRGRIGSCLVLLALDLDRHLHVTLLWTLLGDGRMGRPARIFGEPHRPSPLLAALVVIHNLVVGVHHIVGIASGLCARGTAGAGGLLVRVGVDDLRQLVTGILESLARSLDGLGVGAVKGLLRVGHGSLDLRFDVGGSLVAQVLERLLG